MTFKAPDSLVEQIAQHLAERIIRGEMKERERIQELKVTQELNVSRGSVREALLLLERRHLVTIPPRRGAHVSEITPHHIKSLYELVGELYILLARHVAQRWRVDADLDRLRLVQQRLVEHAARNDIDRFVVDSFEVMRQAFPFADNPYLQETLENLIPAVSRNYHLALERRKTEMGQFLTAFDALLAAVIARDEARIREVLTVYSQHNCQMVLAALADR